MKALPVGLAAVSDDHDFAGCVRDELAGCLYGFSLGQRHLGLLELFDLHEDVLLHVE